MRTSIVLVVAGIALAGTAVAQQPQPAQPAPAAPHAHPTQQPGQACTMSAEHCAMMQQHMNQGGRRFAWFMGIGGQQTDWGDVKTTFNAAGYNLPDNGLFQIGGGGYGLAGRWLLGGEGFGRTSSTVSSPGGRTTRVDGATGFFTLGYVLHERPNHRIYPMIGIGGGSVTFRIEESGGAGLGPNINAPTFGQVLQSPGRRSRLTAGGFALSLGAGFDVMPVTRRRPDGSNYGLLLGVRAGYEFVPVHSDWKLYDLQVAGGPEDLLNGFFVRFSVGGAGQHKRGMRHEGGGGMQHQGGMQHEH